MRCNFIETIIFSLLLAPLADALVEGTSAVSQREASAQRALGPSAPRVGALARGDGICVVLFGAAGAGGLQSQRVSRFLHQAATRLGRQRALRSLTEGAPRVGADGSRPPAPPLRRAEIHPNRTRSSLHNDPNESRFAGLDYFKRFAERAF